MKILVWKSKHADYYVNATDKAKAYLHVFRMIDESGYYSDIEDPDSVNGFHCREGCDYGECKEPESHLSKSEYDRQKKRIENLQKEFAYGKKLYDDAKAGNANAAYRLIQERNGGEYESVEEEEVEEPE